MVGRQRLRRRLRPDVRQKIHMHTAGIIIAILGGVLLFGTSLALSCIKTNDKPSAAETFDLFILGGVFGFFGDLFRAIAPAFPPLILFGVSLMLLAVGGALLMMDGS